MYSIKMNVPSQTADDLRHRWLLHSKLSRRQFLGLQCPFPSVAQFSTIFSMGQPFSSSPRFAYDNYYIHINILLKIFDIILSQDYNILDSWLVCNFPLTVTAILILITFPMGWNTLSVTTVKHITRTFLYFSWIYQSWNNDYCKNIEIT